MKLEAPRKDLNENVSKLKIEDKSDLSEKYEVKLCADNINLLQNHSNYIVYRQQKLSRKSRIKKVKI